MTHLINPKKWLSESHPINGISGQLFKNLNSSINVMSIGIKTKITRYIGL